MQTACKGFMLVTLVMARMFAEKAQKQQFRVVDLLTTLSRRYQSAETQKND